MKKILFSFILLIGLAAQAQTEAGDVLARIDAQLIADSNFKTVSGNIGVAADFLVADGFFIGGGVSYAGIKGAKGVGLVGANLGVIGGENGGINPFIAIGAQTSFTHSAFKYYDGVAQGGILFPINENVSLTPSLAYALPLIKGGGNGAFVPTLGFTVKL